MVGAASVVGTAVVGEETSLARAAWPAQVGVAVHLSVKFAFFALVTVPVTALYDYARVAMQLRFGHGVFVLSSFDVDYVNRERVIVTEDHSTMWARHKMLNGALPVSCLVLYCSFAFVYAQYLGGSRYTRAKVASAAALTWGLVELGFVVLGIEAVYSYAPLLAFVVLFAVLRLVCPAGSKVPTQVIRQMFVVGVGNWLMINVSVGTTDIERFINIFVVLNIFREAGRIAINQSAYYLSVVGCLIAASRPVVATSDPSLLCASVCQHAKAEFPGSQMVYRPATLLLVVWFHIAVTITFRLELTAYDSSAWSYATVLLQAALEIVSRLTVAERDAWLSRSWRLPAMRRFTRVTRVIAPSSEALQGTKDGPGSAAARVAVLREFRAQLIAVEMFAEFAGGSSEPLRWS